MKISYPRRDFSDLTQRRRFHDVKCFDSTIAGTSLIVGRRLLVVDLRRCMSSTTVRNVCTQFVHGYRKW